MLHHPTNPARLDLSGAPRALACKPLACAAYFDFGGEGGSSTQSTVSNTTNWLTQDSFNKTSSVYKTSKKSTKNSNNVTTNYITKTASSNVSGNVGGTMDEWEKAAKDTMKDGKKKKGGGLGFKLNMKTAGIGLAGLAVLWIISRRRASK